MPTFFTNAIFTVNTCDRNIFTLKANCRETFTIGLAEHFAHFGVKF